MTKKVLTTPEIILYRVDRGMWTDMVVSGEDYEGMTDAPVRQTTDFFGNTVFVPIDDEDWE